jgi:hypothetical protein
MNYSMKQTPSSILKLNIQEKQKRQDLLLNVDSLVLNIDYCILIQLNIDY